MKNRIRFIWLVITAVMAMAPNTVAAAVPVPTGTIVRDSTCSADSIEKANQLIEDENATTTKEDSLNSVPIKADAEQSLASKEMPTKLQAILGGILLIAGLLLGYLLAFFIGNKEKKKLHQEIYLKNKEIDRLKADIRNTPAVPAPKISGPEISKATLYNPAKLLKELSESVAKIEQSIVGADTTSRLTEGINRALTGLSAQYPGIKRTLTGWEAEQVGGALTLEKIYQDINVGEMRKSLASLYALSSYARLPGVSEYFKEKNIDHQKLGQAVANIFSGLQKEAKLDFQLPDFGDSYDEQKYDLINKNYGMIHDIDSLGITNILRETMSKHSDRPIIDVEQIGLPHPPENTSVKFSYPTRAVVGFFPKQ
jgi:hypothetical protein